MRKLVNVTFINLQSWGGESLNLSPSRLTVLRGRSEIGKSTLSRFVTRFCDNVNSYDNYDDFIRYGADDGGVLWTYDDGTRLFMLVTHTSRKLGFFAADNTPIESFNDSEITESVLLKYGFFVDDKNGATQNVFSRDIPLMFIETNALLNGSRLARVLINRAVETAQDYLTSQEEIISDCLKDNSDKAFMAVEACKTIKFQDAELLKRSKAQVEQMLPHAQSMQAMYASFIEYCSCIKQLDSLPDYSITSEEISELIEFKSQYSAVSDIFDSYCADKNSVKEYPVDESVISRILNFSTQLKDFQDCFELFPASVPTLPVSEEDFNSLTELCPKIGELCTCFDLWVKSINDLDKAELSLNQSKIDYDNLRNELQICPLCGGEL